MRPADDTGRFKLTSTESDRYAFRSPPLRNVAITRPYFHSGAVWKLRDAVKIMGSAQLGIAITDAEADRITEFLKALTGRQPQAEYPVLPEGTDATPKPQLEIGKG